MIIAAAIRQDGVIYALPAPARHSDVICYMIDDHGIEGPITGEQGFVDSNRGFVGRRLAAAIAAQLDQVPPDWHKAELFSEDLW